MMYGQVACLSLNVMRKWTTLWWIILEKAQEVDICRQYQYKRSIFFGASLLTLWVFDLRLRYLLHLVTYFCFIVWFVVISSSFS